MIDLRIEFCFNVTVEVVTIIVKVTAAARDRVHSDRSLNVVDVVIVKEQTVRPETRVCVRRAASVTIPASCCRIASAERPAAISLFCSFH
jgi:hypothetical protein